MLHQKFKNARLAVLASVDGDKLAEINMKNFIDRKTGVTILANAMPTALSPFDGSRLEPVKDSTVSASAMDLKNMVTIAKCKCGTHHRTIPSLARAIEGERIHCTVCGSTITASVEDPESLDELEKIEEQQLGDMDNISDEDLEAVAALIEDLENNEVEDDAEDMVEDLSDEELEALAALADDYSDEDEDEDSDDDSDEDDSSLTEDDLAVLAALEEMEDSDGDNDADDEPEYTEEELEALAAFEEIKEETKDEDYIDPKILEDLGIEIPEDSDEMETTASAINPEVQRLVEILSSVEESRSAEEGPGSIDNKVDSDVDSVNNPEEEIEMQEVVASINLLNAARRAGLNVKNMEVVASVRSENSKFYLLVDDRPVAAIRPELASEGAKGLFESRHKLYNAIAAAVEADNDLTEETQKDLGIDPMELEVDPSEAVIEQHEKLVEEASAAITAERENFDSKMRQAISIASVGVMKNVWGIENPLYQKLYTELARANVVNPGNLIDRAFSESAEPFLQTVLAKAYELVDKSDDVRNTSAMFVEQASYRGNIDDMSSNNNEIDRKITTGNIAVTASAVAAPSAASAETKSTSKTDLVNHYRNTFF